MGILLKRQTATPSEVVTRIIAMSDALARFWTKSRGGRRALLLQCWRLRGLIVKRHLRVRSRII